MFLKGGNVRGVHGDEDISHGGVLLVFHQRLESILKNNSPFFHGLTSDQNEEGAALP